MIITLSLLLIAASVWYIYTNFKDTYDKEMELNKIRAKHGFLSAMADEVDYLQSKGLDNFENNWIDNLSPEEYNIRRNDIITIFMVTTFNKFNRDEEAKSLVDEKDVITNIKNVFDESRNWKEVENRYEQIGRIMYLSFKNISFELMGKIFPSFSNDLKTLTITKGFQVFSDETITRYIEEYDISVEYVDATDDQIRHILESQNL